MQKRKSLEKLKLYVPGKPADIKNWVKLNANECPYEIPERVYEKVAQIRNMGRYPEGSGFVLRQTIANDFNLSPDNFILGDGSGELIKVFIESFCEKNTVALMPESTFSLYSMYGLIYAMENKVFPLKDNLAIDLDAMLKSIDNRVSVIFICNPNNPTGNAYSYDELEEFFKKVPEHIGIFLDEAYIQFASFYDNERVSELVSRYSNLFVLRTFSKVGLAGARIGYGFGQEEMLSIMHGVRSPFNVSTHAIAFAKALLEEKKFLDFIIENNREQRDFLSIQLKKLGLEVFESETSFVFVRACNDLELKLEEKGVLIRSAKSFAFSSDYYRISIGTKEENQILLEKLQEVL